MEKQDIDFRELLFRYVRHWKLFLLFVFAALFLAFLKLRYSVPKYQINAKIQIVEEGGAGELNVLKDLNVFGAEGNTEITDEIELLKSRENFIEVVRKLKLNIKYSLLGNVRDTELYDNYPFTINFITEDSLLNKYSHTFFVKVLSKTEFRYALEADEEGEKITFGSNISTDNLGDIILIPEEEKRLKGFYNKLIKVSINPVPFVAESYRNNVTVSAAGEYSRILNISFKDAIPERGIAILNSLIARNNLNEVEDKKAVADRTSEFINDRIAEIYSNLSSVDESAENYKESKGIADLGGQSSVNFQQSAASEQELQSANIQLSIASSMQNVISDQNGYEVIPTNVGLTDSNIDRAAAQYNELVSQRNRLLESSNEKNPVIVKLDQQLEGLKKSMQSSLNNVTNNLNLRVNSLSKSLSKINSRIYAAPSNERALRDISRKQQTTESLYLYLLQKREEAQIAFASAAPKSKVVDNAHLANPIPVEPKRKIIYLAALMLGLFIPFSIIYVKDLMDNKVGNMVTLQKVIGEGHSVLAEIPNVKNKEELIVKRRDRSILAESLRILRTNLDYVLRMRNKEQRGHRILVTSSVSGEGKTFVSSNLALIFSSTDKKVLLIGADIRNPKIFSFFGNEQKSRKDNVGFGLTEFLSGEKLEPVDLINTLHIGESKIDVIYSGDIPPNPSELLLSERITELMDIVSSQYDYIIIDSAPLLAVTDTLLIEKYADQVLYITKSGVTEKRILEYPLNLYKEGKLRSLSFIVNGVKETNLGYGGKYGYGYGQEVKPWWKFYSKS
ncbi:tyrosine protein kinase [Croceivirga radicis]|uniref:non-specific protein-tyrosine kinase n=1 Tax=Croceivirga radicis TaxID=1929488 RepID=A0A1V6LSI0_9FLAO|nr:polysaccharide biosynthesis tyrosine autokinase [Croceivirga radicis]OQD43069.1 tyrosine protein kinase [Croceivirga radicis]